jgi:hypothetical protein
MLLPLVVLPVRTKRPRSLPLLNTLSTYKRIWPMSSWAHTHCHRKELSTGYAPVLPSAYQCYALVTLPVVAISLPLLCPLPLLTSSSGPASQQFQLPNSPPLSNHFRQFCPSWLHPSLTSVLPVRHLAISLAPPECMYPSSYTDARSSPDFPFCIRPASQPSFQVQTSSVYCCSLPLSLVLSSLQFGTGLTKADLSSLKGKALSTLLPTH